MTGNAWKTLEYEMEMVNHGLARLREEGASLKDKNMATECVVSHARNLINRLALAVSTGRHSTRGSTGRVRTGSPQG